MLKLWRHTCDVDWLAWAHVVHSRLLSHFLIFASCFFVIPSCHPSPVSPLWRIMYFFLPACISTLLRRLQSGGWINGTDSILRSFLENTRSIRAQGTPDIFIYSVCSCMFNDAFSSWNYGVHDWNCEMDKMLREFGSIYFQILSCNLLEELRNYTKILCLARRFPGRYLDLGLVFCVTYQFWRLAFFRYTCINR